MLMMNNSIQAPPVDPVPGLGASVSCQAAQQCLCPLACWWARCALLYSYLWPEAMLDCPGEVRCSLPAAALLVHWRSDAGVGVGVLHAGECFCPSQPCTVSNLDA